MKLGSCRLDQIAEVGLGFKSLQNQFFYLSQETIATYGIETKYLRPIYKLSYLNAGKYAQTATTPLRVFYCRDNEKDLRGTGALRYIRAMENRPATRRKQAGVVQTIRDALEDQTSPGGTWYMPKALLHEQQIWLRKAVSTVYSPYFFESPVAVDQRCNFIKPVEGLAWEIVAAVLTSSLFVLSAESSGSCALGAGALELTTTMLRELRVPDARKLADGKAKQELVQIARRIWSTTDPFDWGKSGNPPLAVRYLDEWLLGRMGAKISLEKVYSDVKDLVQSRLQLAKDKSEQVHKSEQINVTTVARSIAETVRPLLESIQFPESCMGTDSQRLPITIGNESEITIRCYPLMDQATLIVEGNSGKVMFDAQVPRSVAQVIVKALLIGRRAFVAPTDMRSAEQALGQFGIWFGKIGEKIATGCAASAVGTSYEQQVHQGVLDALGIDRRLSVPDFYGEVKIRHSALD